MIKVKLPVEVEQFAKDYFAAEARATLHPGDQKRFRPVDQKHLARNCKVLLDSGVVENMNQLTKDLVAYQDGNDHSTHHSRLKTFAKRSGITLTKQPRITYKRPGLKVERIPFNLKSVLHSSFHEALRSGFTLTTLEEQVKEVFEEHSTRVKQETRIQAIITKFGLSREQIVQLSKEVQGLHL